MTHIWQTRFQHTCWVLVWLIGAAAPAQAQDSIENTASTAFAKMPLVRVVQTISGACGADQSVSTTVAYCTSANEILLAANQIGLPQMPYLVAHAYGHAVQVQHGVADVALREITARRAQEVALRGLVDRQVDCIAGFLYDLAGFAPASLTQWFTDDPFASVHWGRNPLHAGPVMPVPLADRDIWFRRGQGGDLANCGVGEFGSDLLIAAYRG